MTGMPRIVSRLAALGLLGAVLLAAWFYAVVPVTAHVRQIDEQIAHNNELIDRLSRTIANRGTYGAQIEALARRIEESGHYIRAETEPLAAAALQEHLTRVMAGAGGELKSVQSLQSEQQDGLTRVGVRVVMRGEYGPLVQALYDLEVGEPYLFIDNVRIKSQSSRRRLRRDAEEAETQLSIVFDLYGYLPPRVEL